MAANVRAHIEIVPNLRRFQWWRATQRKPTDLADIDTFVASQGLRVLSVTQTDNHLYYWLRGNLLLSNLARTFVVIAQASDGVRREIHIAFDPLRRPKGPRVLLERAAA